MSDAAPNESDLDPRERTLGLLRRWGWNATGFQVLERGFRYFFDGDDACVPYMDTGGAWVVAGAPIGPVGRLAEVTSNFEAAARKAKRRVCFFAVEHRFLRATGLSSIVIGEQPTWNPQRWGEELKKRASLREQIRRARAKGVRVRGVAAEELADQSGRVRLAVEALVARWLGTRSMPRMRFLVDVQLLSFPEERRYFIAERGNEVVGFLGAVPVFARAGWLFEDLLRDPKAPNGTAEVLVHEAMNTVAREGSTYATLGLAPLSGAISHGLARVRRWARMLYDFEGLRAFKGKLSPHTWDPVLLAYPKGASPKLALYDVLRAFAGGSFMGFGLRTLLRGPAFVIRALAVLLIPWTWLLATASASWFPSSHVQYAWVCFDVLLAVALFSLSRMWRRWLGVLLATAVTGDAVLTSAEALHYNLPRTMHLTHNSGIASAGSVLVVLAIACLGPILGAFTLWGAVRRTARASSSIGISL